MELIVLAVVGIAGLFIGAYVSGRVTSRIATEQAQRGRRVELYTDLLPAVLPALERGEGTNEEVRQIVEGSSEKPRLQAPMIALVLA